MFRSILGALRHPNRRSGNPANRSFVAAVLVALVAMVVAPLALVGPASATEGSTTTNQLTYTGQGIKADGTVDQRCDVQDEPSGAAANDPYLMFVFTGGSATNVQLHVPAGVTVYETVVKGGSVHIFTSYVDPSSLIGQVKVTWQGDAGSNPQLTISHGCSGSPTPPPPTTQPGTATAECGACSVPGAANGTAVIKVTNPNNVPEPYKVTVNGQVQDVIVPANTTAPVTFGGLAAGTYDWSVTGPGGTKICHKVVVKDCPPQILKDAAASVNVTQPTCQNRTATVTYTLVNATATPAVPDNSPGTHQSVATANPNHLFGNGSSTKDLSYTVNPSPSDDDCATYVVPIAPTVTQDQCTGPGQSGGFSVTLANGPEGVSYSFNQETLVVTATADSTGKFSDSLPEGWVKVDNHHATYQVVRTSPGNCLVMVTPGAPTATTPSCAQPNITVTPSNQPGVVSSPSGATVLAPGESVTYTESPAQGYAFSANTQTSWPFTNSFNVKHCNTPPPPHHHVVRHPRGHLNCGCNGHASARLSDRHANRGVTFYLTAHKGSWSTAWAVRVRANHSRVFRFEGRKFPVGTKLVIKAGGKVLDRAKVPARCLTSGPHSGLRVSTPKAS